MKEKIVAEYNNNRTQWMMEHNCKNDKDILFKMMELYAEHKLEQQTELFKLTVMPYKFKGEY